MINASAAGVIQAAQQNRLCIGKVLAGQNGILGALREELIDTSRESNAAIEGLKSTPGGAFGSCRYKLQSLSNSPLEYERLINVFRAHNIGYFLYNGGGDSADTCLKVSQISKKMGYPVRAIHIPKTIDNDLPFTDTCPGFGSVAKYVAISTREAAMDVASMCGTSTKVFILEVMGRHAGWIAGASALAAETVAEAPHIILFPEIIFNEIKFLKRVKQTVERYGYCVVVASEGVRSNKYNLLSEQGTSDAFGHAQLGGLAPILARMVEENLGYKYHWAVADYLQRAARHIASQTDVSQAIAVGRAGVELALQGFNAVMPTIERKSDKPYRWSTGIAPLKKVANRERKVPRKFISRDGYSLTPAGLAYFGPLIAGEAYPSYKKGMPIYTRLKKVLVPKYLPLWSQ